MKGIEYVDKQWSPVSMKCTPVSEGCVHCWALRMANRLAKNPSIHEKDRRAYAGQWLYLNPNRLEAPLHWRKPARIGLQFMGDWMHPDVPNEWIDRILEVISACPQHTFFSLTKRTENLDEKLYGITEHHPLRFLGGGDYLPNLFLGATVCNQPEADKKIPEILKIPGFKKWVSIEPCLENIELNIKSIQISHPDNEGYGVEMIKGLSWIVSGSETGPGARPADPAWFRSLRDQAQAAGVPFFLKRLSDGSRVIDGQEWNELPT